MLYDSSIVEHWSTPSSPARGQELWPYDMKAGIPQGEWGQAGGRAAASGGSAACARELLLAALT